MERKKIKLSDITKHAYPDDIEGYKLIEQEQSYFDGEKGYIRYRCITQRISDSKYFMFEYEDWGRGQNNLLEVEAEEVVVFHNLKGELDHGN